MLGDEAQPAVGDGPRARAASGPRHAAPRKSLLTKLHVPAGKAVALAAMPTAVLMGMGLTPHLAQADEPKNPAFKAGPCVTRSDTPSPGATGKDAGKDDKDGKGSADTAKGSGKDSEDGKDGKDGKDSDAGTAGKGGTATDTPKPSTSPSADEKPAAKDSPSASATKAPAQQPKADPTTAAPSPTKSVNPLDPLGLGDILSGLLGGGKTATPAPTTTAPQPDPTTTTAKPDPSPSDTHASTTPHKPAASDTPVKDAAKGAGDAAKKAAKALTGAGASPSDSPSAGASPSATDGSGTPQSYPCPTYDAQALADAQTEPGIPLLPDQPWTLKSSVLTLHGLNYDGIVQVRTENGTVKDVLKFTASGVDIGDLDQFVVGPDNTQTEVKAAKGSTSTIRNGTVTMYTESLSGNLLGLIPITFTPKAPPPLTLPELFFTDVTVIQAGQFGGDLHVPGMQVLPNQT